MPRPPRIFVSHSAHDSATAEFLDALHKQLDEGGFEPLVDRYELRKQLGTKWRDALHTWMELCDAAVILINERAVTGPSWVPHEATVFYMRQRHDRSFPIIPVLLPPVTLEQAVKRFHAQDLDEIQAEIVVTEMQEAGKKQAIADIINRLRPLCNRELPDSKAAKVEDYVAEFLSRVTPHNLRRIAREKRATRLTSSSQHEIRPAALRAC
ncbi:MAG: toll/interleukin-1 receptor domain-containing protein [Rhodospirillales bacterium]|nr:toll/interleukin-1 receptor domain-containing protein [Rhodospirillales bacterium]